MAQFIELTDHITNGLTIINVNEIAKIKESYNSSKLPDACFISLKNDNDVVYVSENASKILSLIAKAQQSQPYQTK